LILTAEKLVSQNFENESQFYLDLKCTTDKEDLVD